MDKNIKFEYCNGTATCHIEYKNMTFTGTAQCHPDDMDFESERTGCYIAETRAVIKVLRFQRDFEIKPALNILNHLHSNMKTSKHYNPKSYEVKMIHSQIHVLEKELAVINSELAIERTNLSVYLNEKEKIYTRLRAKNQ